MKILILCNVVKHTAATVYDHISAFLKYSEHQFELYNCIKNKLTLDFLSQYDAVIIHYNILVELDYYLSPINRYILSLYNGLKIIFLQDENRNVDKLVNAVKCMRVNILFTVVPEEEILKVYPAENLPEGIVVINTLTGYVQENLIKIHKPTYTNRKLDVVYRARKMSACFGRLCHEKFTIAEDFITHTKDDNLLLDISAQESDRVYGKAWIDFLLSSKACLGVESGASLFDYTGEIRAKVERHELLYPNSSFDELEKLYFMGLDYNVNYNQISPRHFEAAALKTLMILFEGKYSGVLQPGRHYVPLKKDFSNIKEVIALLRDQSKYEEITNTAFEEIANNKKYSFEYFVENFDKAINAHPKSIQSKTLKVLYKSDNVSNYNKNIITTKIGQIILSILNKIKITIRQLGAKAYWWLDKVCNQNAHKNAPKSFGSIKSRALVYAKNKIKLLAMRARDYDTSKSKFLILCSTIYYKKYLKKQAVYKIHDELIFCLHEQSLESVYNQKFRCCELLFKKIKICDNCRMFIGF